MKQLLVPTDFSEDAAKAYPVAASLAKQYQARICLYHINYPKFLEEFNSWDGFGMYNAPSQRVEQADISILEKRLSELAQLEIFQGIEVSTKISQATREEPFNVILEELNNDSHDFIVMGTAGENQEGESVAEIIVRHTTTPMVTVKESVESFSPKDILVVTDFDTISKGFVKRVESFSRQFEAKMHMLFVNTAAKFKTQKEVERLSRQLKRKYQMSDFQLHVYNATDLQSGIKEFVESNHMDFIAITTHGRRGLTHLFSGSAAEDLVNESAVPVFAYNLHEYLKHKSTGYGTGVTPGFG